MIAREDIRRVRDALVCQGAQEPLVGVLTETMFDDAVREGVIPSDVVVLDRSEGTVTFRVPPDLL